MKPDDEGKSDGDSEGKTETVTVTVTMVGLRRMMKYIRNINNYRIGKRQTYLL